MKILTESAQAELTIKKSVFRAEVFSVTQSQEAKEIIKQQKERYRDARHVVHAFVIGEQGEVLGCSDDGEPAGTAGQPVLSVIKGSSITNVLMTVTRWFGGTLLGTGGLVRAYSDVAKLVLATAPTEPLIKKVHFSLTCRYEEHQKLLHTLASLPITFTDAEFSQLIVLSGFIPVEYKEEFSRLVTRITKGDSIARFSD